jgi:exosortase C (VPDSG-CTERM-specific)
MNSPVLPPQPASAEAPISHRKLLLLITALALAFARPIYDFAQFAVHSDLYSYVLLVPVLSLYFTWQQRSTVRAGGKQVSHLCWAPFAAGTALLIWYGYARLGGERWDTQDYLAVTISAWLLFVAAVCLWLLDPGRLRALAFPLGFLVFMVPLPLVAEEHIEAFLQHGSALTACLFFKLTGTPYVYENLTFNLPGFSMHVAPECSGIHSSIVLFITSAVAGHLFLRSPWKQAFLMLAVIPLGLLRNGFRVFVIGELCVRSGPEMIDSWIHRRGGPVFFLLSLAPLFFLLILLLRSERRAAAPHNNLMPSP